MRILVDSFEEWYAGQFHYKKVDGTKPGKKYAHTMSVYEMADLIGRSSAVAYGVKTLTKLDDLYRPYKKNRKRKRS